MNAPTVSAELPEAPRNIQRFEVVDCIDSKHVPAVIPNASGPWVRYEDRAAQVEALSAAGVPAVAVGWIDDGGMLFWKGEPLPDGSDIYAAPQPIPSPAPAQPVHGDVLPPVGSRVFIRHGRDDDAHACTVMGYYAWGDLGGDKRLHRVFVRLVYEGTITEQARMLCDCYPTAEAALASTAPAQPGQEVEPITLPREMDEDLWYIVGSALGAQSPEQCSRAKPLWDKLVQRADADRAARAAPQPANPWQRALEIRMAQGWKLKGDRIPVLYTDTINGDGVGRDDLWLCTTAALTAPKPAADYDHGPQATTVEEAAHDVGKWLNERPNRPIDLRHVAMLAHYAQAPQPATADAVDAKTESKIAMADEYQRWIDYFHKGGGYDDFLRVELAAQREVKP